MNHLARRSLLLALLVAPPLAAKPLERVPQDGTLQQAIARVSDQGVIEIAAGVYVPPAGGFEARNLGKSFTVRAAAGAEVVLDGQGVERVFAVRGNDTGGGQTVSFEGLTFRDGFSADAAFGGGVTVAGSRAVFVSCDFEDNASTDTTARGGGALQVRDGSFVRCVGCRFEGNSASLRGGAVYANESTVELVWSELIDNRTNLPNHSTQAAGGAVFGLDAEIVITLSRLEGNEAGTIGGAINVFGIFREPLDDPPARLTIVKSVLSNNRTAADPCCDPPGPSVGGAIHVEDHVTLSIEATRFEDNVADWGGAIASYRALVEISDSLFRGNRALGTDVEVAAGGAINMTSADFADASTDFGPINRRAAELFAENTLFQGSAGDAVATQGGCLFAAGDVTRMDGLGVPQGGTLEENRTRVELVDVIFFDCDVETSLGTGFGGALYVDLAELAMTGSLVLDSDALGAGAAGGGLTAFNRSAVSLSASTFARNSAEVRGGAVLLNSGEVEIDECVFLENDVTPGTSEPVQQATGAALSVSPNAGQGLDITGTVQDSIFTQNVGLPVVDIDFTAGPFNRVVYDGNDFHSTTFGTSVYKNLAVGFGGLTVNALNSLVIPRTGAPSTDKSTRANRRLTAVPQTGRVVAAPSVILTKGVPDGDPESAFLGFAWSGPSATLGGDALGDTVGLVAVGVVGQQALRVGGQTRSTATVDELGCTGGSLLCLNQERFLLQVDWRDFGGNSGRGEVVPFGSDDSGLLFFFAPDNWEMLVKVLNGCGITNHFWVFSAATTNVEYTLRVTDTAGGATTSFFNALGAPAAAITDTEALAVCEVPGASGAPTRLGSPEAEARVFRRQAAELRLRRQAAELKGPTGSCTPDEEGLCLNRSRFRVEVDFRDFTGTTGNAEVVPVPIESDDSGLFFFFDPDNWEMLVKVLDGCGFNGHFWVFSAATTNIEYTLRVTDTETGAVMEYLNPLGTAAAAVTDTGAFPTCP